MKLLSDLFVNLCILGMLFFTLNLLTRNREGFISPSQTVWRRLQFGVAAGVLGNVVMFYTIHFNGTILDLRQIPVFIAAIYGGFCAPVTASVMIAAGRIGMFGLDRSTMYAAGLIILVGAVCGVLSFIVKSGLYKKWLLMNVTSMTLTSIVFAILLPDRSVLFKVYCGFLPVTLIGGFVILNLMEYFRQTKEMYQSAQVDAVTDFLTGLNNVRRFDDILKQSLQKADHHHEQVSFILLDIDHFKQVNDRYGHASGDEVLKQLAQILGECCRSVDIVSRNGGEEFSVILPSCNKFHALEVAERIRSRMEGTRLSLTNGISLSVTVSLGVATYGETTFEHDELVKQADDCLYEAKRTGRNKVMAA